MCETRDLGIKWPQWQTSILDGEARINMRCVCPTDVMKVLLQQARTVYWKKWAAKHEYEELKEGISLELALALMRKKTKEDWTEKHRNVATKLVWKEAVCRNDSSTKVGRMKVSAKPVTRRKVQKNTGSTIAQNGTNSRDSRCFPKEGAKSENFKEGVEMAKKYCDASTQ